MPALISRLLPPIFLSVFLAAATTAGADVVGSARPQALPKEVKVLRGQTAEIPLSVATESNKQVEFRIATPPEHGKLGAITYFERDTRSGVIQYTPPTDPEIREDVFLYKARIPDLVVSEGVPVKIKIVDPEARLVMEKGLSFGRVLLGEEKVERLQILNEGNGTFEGVIDLPPPWFLADVASQIVIAPNEALLLPVIFRPSERGAKRYRLVLQPDLVTGSVEFFGEGYSPISASPSTAQLVWDGEKKWRSARITVTNSTDQAQRVAVFADARLQAGEDFEIPAQGSHVIEPWLPAADQAAFTGKIALEADGFREVVEVRATVMPAVIEVLEPVDGALGFAHHVGDDSEVRTVKLRNAGGTRAFLYAEVTPPFRIAEGSDSIAIEPGKELEFHLGMDTGRTGEYERELTITGGPETLKFAVNGTVVQQGTTLPQIFAGDRVPQEDPEKEKVVPKRNGLGTGVVAPWAMEAYLRSVGVEASAREVNDSVPQVDRVYLKARTKTRLDLWWRHPEKKGAWKYLVEARWMDIDPADGFPKPVWYPLTGVEFSEDLDGVTAVMEGLKPGFEYIMRVVVTDGKDRFGDPTPTFVFGTEVPKNARWWKWLLGVLVVAGLGGGYWYWRKRQLAEI